MAQTKNTDKKKTIVASDYFFLANQYLDVYQTLSEKIQAPKTPKKEK